jgi:hypothetical protein
MRYLSSILSGVFVSILAISLPAQAQPPQDLPQALMLVGEANYQCHAGKKLDACDKLQVIEKTLLIWCSQGDAGACDIYNHARQFNVLASRASASDSALD